MRSIFVVFLVLISQHLYANNSLEKLVLEKASGSYELEMESSSTKKSIEIFYYKPVGFNENTSVIIVIPGAGRNADDYRDSWIKHAEKFNLLVLSPSYPKKHYDFAAYHLGGVVSNLKLNDPTITKYKGKPSKYHVKDEDISFSFVNDSSAWIFDDFDQIFSSVKSIIGPTQVQYDLFGHSAGGQILHRYVLFKKESKANRIVAANSGFYTLPEGSQKYPFGLARTLLNEGDIRLSFAKNLIVLLGEADDKNEQRGTMLHTPIADSQGLGRYERGRYFYKESEKHAASTPSAFNWRLEIVKNVGHDYKKMGDAAANILYGNDSRANRAH